MRRKKTRIHKRVRRWASDMFLNDQGRVGSCSSQAGRLRSVLDFLEMYEIEGGGMTYQAARPTPPNENSHKKVIVLQVGIWVLFISIDIGRVDRWNKSPSRAELWIVWRLSHERIPLLRQFASKGWSVSVCHLANHPVAGKSTSNISSRIDNTNC